MVFWLGYMVFMGCQRFWSTELKLLVNDIYAISKVIVELYQCKYARLSYTNSTWVTDTTQLGLLITTQLGLLTPTQLGLLTPLN